MGTIRLGGLEEYAPDHNRESVRCRDYSCNHLTAAMLWLAGTEALPDESFVESVRTQLPMLAFSINLGIVSINLEAGKVRINVSGHK